MNGSREISLVPSLHRASTDALIGIDTVHSITDVWGYDREFCSSSSSSSTHVTQKPKNIN